MARFAAKVVKLFTVSHDGNFIIVALSAWGSVTTKVKDYNLLFVEFVFAEVHAKVKTFVLEQLFNFD